MSVETDLPKSFDLDLELKVTDSSEGQKVTFVTSLLFMAVFSK